MQYPKLSGVFSSDVRFQKFFVQLMLRHGNRLYLSVYIFILGELQSSKARGGHRLRLIEDGLLGAERKRGGEHWRTFVHNEKVRY
jgi:hypothetical protein